MSTLDVPPRLVILGDNLTALGVARDAASLRLEPVIVDYTRGPAIASRRYDHRIVPNDERSTVDAIAKLAAVSHANIIATGDAWLRFIVRNRAALDGAILHAPNDVLETCLDKIRFANWCVANGINAPRHWIGTAASIPDDLKFPLLVRPAVTLHSMPAPPVPKATEVVDAPALAELLRQFRDAGVTPLVCESLLSQRLTQFSVPFARDASGSMRSFVAAKVRPPPHWCRVGTYVELSPDVRAEALARDVVSKLACFGIGEVEILFSHDSGEYFVVEVNARPWLQYPLAMASGHDFLAFLLGLSNVGAVPRKHGLRWLEFRSDLYTCFSRSEGLYWHGGLTTAGYVRSLWNANVFPTSAPRVSHASDSGHSVLHRMWTRVRSSR